MGTAPNNFPRREKVGSYFPTELKATSTGGSFDWFEVASGHRPAADSRQSPHGRGVLGGLVTRPTHVTEGSSRVV